MFVLGHHFQVFVDDWMLGGHLLLYIDRHLNVPITCPQICFFNFFGEVNILIVGLSDTFRSDHLFGYIHMNFLSSMHFIFTNFFDFEFDF